MENRVYRVPVACSPAAVFLLFSMLHHKIIVKNMPSIVCLMRVYCLDKSYRSLQQTSRLHEAEFMSASAAQNALANMLPSQTPNPNLPNPDNNQALGAPFFKGVWAKT